MRAVIFDMDGVLVDSEPIYDGSTAQYLAELGVVADPAAFALVRGLKLHSVWEVLARHHGLAHPVAELAAESARRLDSYFAALPDVPPIDGVRELIEALHGDGVPLAVASSSRRSRVEILLDKLGLRPYFAAVISGDEVEHGKPHPEAFLAAAALLGVDPPQCLVVEDSPNGVRAALAAGMRCVAFAAAGRDSCDLAGAHLVVDDMRTLQPGLLRKLWGPE